MHSNLAALIFSVMGTNNFFACFIFIIFILFSGSFMQISFTTDTLKPGQSIRTGENLTSTDEIFWLGFFYLGSFDKRYLGLRYKRDSGNYTWILWIANRDNPVSGTTGAFTLTVNGDLSVSDSGGSSTTLYSGSAASNSTLKLLDSGNLVLREGNSDNQGRILWQSFDHPTDMLFPRMKLGANLRSGQHWSLASWLSETDPAPGDFTLGLDPNGTNQLFIWRRRVLYWTSGVWNGSSFPNTPDIVWSDSYDFRFSSNEDEHYFTYSIKNGSVVSALTLYSTGEFLQLVWSAGNPDQDVWVAQCGGNSDHWSMGCVVQNSTLNCSNGDNFLSRRQAPLSPPLDVNDSSLGLINCEAACKSNCSCTAYTILYGNITGCSFWYGELDGYQSTGEKEIYFRSRDNIAQNPDEGSKRSLKLIILLTIAPTMILISFITCYVLRRKHKRRGEMVSSQQQLLFELSTNRESLNTLMNPNNPRGDGGRDPELPIFSFAIISLATDNFAFANKLGQGGYGPVYKGKLLEGQEIAVKRLSKNSKQGDEEFKNELTLIAKVQHLNLVRLIGCCIEAEERMLIYEYMPNGSLDSFLFENMKGAQLDWGKRANIIEGIAQGILYLHRYSRIKIIHRDLKASNILLDNEMNPKISDFGLARIFEQNTSEAKTKRPAGTYGYMAPEYAFQGLFSMKSDVFSFGVLLLEIISGMRCTDLYHFNHSLNLLGHAWELWKDDRGSELIDPLLGESSPRFKVLRYINMALLCVQESATDRPTMSDIVSMLSNEGIALPFPKQPAFSISVPVSNATSLIGDSISCSINDVTISKIKGR